MLSRAKTKPGKDAGRVCSRRLRAGARTRPGAGLQPRERTSVGGWSTLRLLDVDSRNPAAALLERGVVARRLGADQPAEAEVLAGDRQLVAPGGGRPAGH